jgi:hypothetical protein
MISNDGQRGHAPPGRRLDPGSGHREGPAALLVVVTGGPVLDPKQVAFLAQPFQRLGTDRTGSGTGSGPGTDLEQLVTAADADRGADMY